MRDRANSCDSCDACEFEGKENKINPWIPYQVRDDKIKQGTKQVHVGEVLVLEVRLRRNPPAKRKENK